MASRPGKLMGYAGLGWALGAVAVPLYIQIPYLYTRSFGVQLAWVSAILLATRFIDALMDPLLGVWIDRWKARRGYLAPILLAAPLLALGMWGVLLPFAQTPVGKAISLGISLVVVHLGYSLAMIAYQSWGAELGSTDQENSKYVAAREAVGIAGVIVAVSLPASQYAGPLFLVFLITLIIGLVLLVKYAPRPGLTAHTARDHESTETLSSLMIPLKRPAFRVLLLVFLVNGVAGALPATLVPFFLRDRLMLAENTQWTLGVYFLVGALSTLIWVPLAGRIGLVKCWMIGMVLTVIAFLGVFQISTGSVGGFLVICVLTGLALGTDLALPAALLAKVIHNAGDTGRREGAYFGLWNWVNKFNLAVAPAIALPLLGFFGYEAAGQSASQVASGALQNTNALMVVYAVIPCALKLFAIVVTAWGGLFKLDQTDPIPLGDIHSKSVI